MTRWLEGTDIDDLFAQAITLVRTWGGVTHPRGQTCLGLGPVGLTLVHPRARVLSNPVRAAKKYFMAGECSWILTGSQSAKQISFYNKKMMDYSDDGVILAGAYGPRLEAQIPWVIQKLKDDPDTRQAVMTIWTPTPEVSKDIPCTLSLNFRRTPEGKLDLTTQMRSNDLWLGFPYDVFTFTVIQELVASLAGIPLGKYHHVVTDLHLYEKHLEIAKQATSSHSAYHFVSEWTPQIIGKYSLCAWITLLSGIDTTVRSNGEVNLDFIEHEPLLCWLAGVMSTRRKSC